MPTSRPLATFLLQDPDRDDAIEPAECRPGPFGVRTTLAAPGATVVPSFLPNGRHFIFVRCSGRQNAIYLGSQDAKPEQQNAKLPMTLDSRFAPVYGPSPDPRTRNRRRLRRPHDRRQTHTRLGSTCGRYMRVSPPAALEKFCSIGVHTASHGSTASI